METSDLPERVRQYNGVLRHIFGRNLAWYRRGRGMKQLDVAHQLGYRDHTMVSKFERGRRWPPFPKRLALALILAVPLAWLLWEPFPPPPLDQGWPTVT